MRRGALLMIERKYLLLLVVASLIVAIDQLTKLYVHTNFDLGEYVPVVAGYFNITYVRNPGAAFGIFRASLAVFRELFFLAMPPLAMITILAILRGVSTIDRVHILALSAIFGG